MSAHESQTYCAVEIISMLLIVLGIEAIRRQITVGGLFPLAIGCYGLGYLRGYADAKSKPGEDFIKPQL